MSVQEGYYDLDILRPVGLPTGSFTVEVEFKPGKFAYRKLWPSDGSVYVKDGKVTLSSPFDIKNFLKDSGPVYREVFENSNWPNDAEYKVYYGTRCWPCGMDHHVRFFRNKEELDTWYAQMKSWNRLEDNVFHLSMVEQWDLGPNMIKYA